MCAHQDEGGDAIHQDPVLSCKEVSGFYFAKLRRSACGSRHWGRVEG